MRSLVFHKECLHQATYRDAEEETEMHQAVCGLTEYLLQEMMQSAYKSVSSKLVVLNGNLVNRYQWIPIGTYAKNFLCTLGNRSLPKTFE